MPPGFKIQLRRYKFRIPLIGHFRRVARVGSTNEWISQDC